METNLDEGGIFTWLCCVSSETHCLHEEDALLAIHPNN